MLCHPDIVSDELKEQAQIIFQQLNDANSKRDIKRVREILLSLESGSSFDVASDMIEDKELLKVKITDLRDLLLQNEIEIENIKESEIFKIIQENDNLEEYFKQVRTSLEDEYNQLRRDGE
jgi:hypothetical protein